MIWKEIGRGNHDQNVLYKFSMKKRKRKMKIIEIDENPDDSIRSSSASHSWLFLWPLFMAREHANSTFSCHLPFY